MAAQQWNVFLPVPQWLHLDPDHVQAEVQDLREILLATASSSRRS